MIASTSPLPNAAENARQRRMGRPPLGVASERREQLALGAAVRDAARPDRAGAAVEVLALGEPGRDLGDQVRVEPGVAAGRDGQVPAVDEVVGGELVDVLVELLLAVRQVDGAARRAAARATAVVASIAASSAPRTGSSPSRSPSRLVAHLRDGAAVDQRRGPEVLADDVVDQVAHRPVAARRGVVPLVGGRRR